MSYSCKILLDSVSETGKRLTTMEITFPRCVLAEAETHRVFSGWDGNVEELIIHNLGINVDKNLSRNSASSRAIPINKMLDKVRTDPFIPEKWGKPVKGMGAKEYWPTDSQEHEILTAAWTNQLKTTISTVSFYEDIGNKEDLNRLLEPWLYHTAIITATEWDNFFKLRTDSAADWKIKKIADLMYSAYHNPQVQPTLLRYNEWHCPLVTKEDEVLIDDYIVENLGHESIIDSTNLEIKKKISVARCARISYLTHDGKRDIAKDLELFERLRTSGHNSPVEHIATPMNNNVQWSGNFQGWKQWRKEFPNENCTYFRKEN
jgi:hypothetical protein